MVTQLYYPYGITASGRTRLATHDEHIRQLIALVLLTTPGDRVNRPTFGAGLMQIVFAPASTGLQATVEAMVQSALMQWMAELVRVESVSVQVAGSGEEVEVTVVYTELATNQTNTLTFTQSMTAGS